MSQMEKGGEAKYIFEPWRMAAAFLSAGESSAWALREEGKRRNRTWLHWVVKRRQDSLTRRRVVVPATRRRGDGVATGKEEMVARAVL